MPTNVWNVQATILVLTVAAGAELNQSTHLGVQRHLSLHLSVQEDQNELQQRDEAQNKCNVQIGSYYTDASCLITTLT